MTLKRDGMSEDDQDNGGHLRLVPDPVPESGEAWPGGPPLKQTKTGTLTEWACRLCSRVYPNDVSSYVIDVNDHEWSTVACDACRARAWRELAAYAQRRADELE